MTVGEFAIGARDVSAGRLPLLHSMRILLTILYYDSLLQTYVCWSSYYYLSHFPRNTTQAQEEQTLGQSFGGARALGFGDGGGGGLNIEMLTSATRPLERARDAQHATILDAIKSSDRAADAQWRQWAELNLERGCTIDGIRTILTERGGYGFKSEGRKGSRSPPRPRKAPQPHPRSARKPRQPKENRKDRGSGTSKVVLG